MTVTTRDIQRRARKLIFGLPTGLGRLVEHWTGPDFPRFQESSRRTDVGKDRC